MKLIVASLALAFASIWGLLALEARYSHNTSVQCDATIERRLDRIESELEALKADTSATGIACERLDSRVR